MRPSGWIILFVMILLWLLTVAYPVCMVGASLFQHSSGTVPLNHLLDVLLTTVLWSGLIGVSAVLLGWIPGRLLGSITASRSTLLISAMLLLPICLPAYMVFYAWWQSWPADSALFQWARSHDLLIVARMGTLWLGLLCWSWPIVAWCVGVFHKNQPEHLKDMLLLDGASRWQRFLVAARYDRKGLLLGFFIVFLITFNNTTCFDLAQVFAFGNELRAARSLSTEPGTLLLISLPAVGITSLGAIIVWFTLPGSIQRTPIRIDSHSRKALLATIVIWLASVVLPFGLLVGNLIGRGGVISHSREFISLYGHSVVQTVLLAIVCGGVVAVISLCAARLGSSRLRSIRIVNHIMTVTWLIAALVPATIIAVAFEAAYNRPFLADVVYGSSLVLMLGYIARFGFLGAWFGHWLIRHEPQENRDLRLLDGADTLISWMTASTPRWWTAAIASWAITIVMVIGEIPLTAQLHPPGTDPLALATLNAMHYQRPQTVLIATLLIALAALLGAFIISGIWFWSRRREFSHRMIAGFVFFILALVPGCGGGDLDTPEPLNVITDFGSPGEVLGQFNYPRGLAVDRKNEFIYIVDKTARIQRFTFAGEPLNEWRMPIWELGKPTGLNVAPDGRVFVADTHYYRIIAYDEMGNEQMRFGDFGTEPGQFIYPTDVEFDRNGRIYVSEYGGNDRIQVFSPQGEFQFSFGSYGSEPDQFNRPQSMVFNADCTELFIADAVNHRIVVVDSEGHFLRILGSYGRGPGQLAYPYDLTLLPDGSLLVCEMGNNRLQQLDINDGNCLEIFGCCGRGIGELQYPWAVDCSDSLVFVLDSGNNRVQVIRQP